LSKIIVKLFFVSYIICFICCFCCCVMPVKSVTDDVLSSTPVHMSHTHHHHHHHQQLSSHQSATEGSIDVDKPAAPAAGTLTAESLGDLVISSAVTNPSLTCQTRSPTAETSNLAVDVTEASSQVQSASHVGDEVKNETKSRAADLVHRRRRRKYKKKNSLVTSDEQQQQQQQVFDSQEIL